MISLPPNDWLAYEARRYAKHWRVFEYGVMKSLPKKWDRPRAEAFHAHVVEQLYPVTHPFAVKPIVFDLPVKAYHIGEHAEDRIRLKVEQFGKERWRTLFHEFAHYRIHHHRKMFVQELALVYRLWLTWSEAPKIFSVNPK